ncbi:MAG: NYN domain-containing protein [Candidatus Brocadiae bacterium]|nr:NYN domain-containing protein [Candidatus Brocadiia bacterium]
MQAKETMPLYPEGRQMALFLDIDNFLRIGKDGRDFDLFINAIRPWGRISLCRAYGNSLATRPQLYCQLMKYNFLLTSSSQIYKKNGADIQIATEVMEIVHTRPIIRTFVIASGDSDFIALVESLHQYQKTVIGIGSRNNTSPKFLETCDAFLFYEDILELNSGKQDSDLQECSISCKTTPEQMKRLLRKRGLYPPEPILRRQILTILDGLKPEFSGKSITFHELQEKLSEVCKVKQISNNPIRSLLRTLSKTGILVPCLDLPISQRPILPLPGMAKLEEEICLYLLDVLLNDPDLVAEPLALSQAIWGDASHIKQIQQAMYRFYERKL